MGPCPIFNLILEAFYWCSQLMYYLSKTIFGKVIKTLKIEQAEQYIWRTLYGFEMDHKYLRTYLDFYPQFCISNHSTALLGEVLKWIISKYVAWLHLIHHRVNKASGIINVMKH